MKKTIALFLVSMLTGCVGPSITEISRISDPLNSVDAVVAIRNTDATVATPMEVYLIPHGIKVDGDPIFRADHVDDLRVSWEGATQVVIQVKEARPFVKLTSYPVRLPDGSMKQVAIRLAIKKIID